MVDLIDRPTLDFYLGAWLGLEDMLARPEFAEHTVESVNAMLDTADRLAQSHFLPHFKKADIQEPVHGPNGAQ